MTFYFSFEHHYESIFAFTKARIKSKLWGIGTSLSKGVVITCTHKLQWSLRSTEELPAKKQRLCCRRDCAFTALSPPRHWVHSSLGVATQTPCTSVGLALTSWQPIVRPYLCPHAMHGCSRWVQYPCLFSTCIQSCFFGYLLSSSIEAAGILMRPVDRVVKTLL